MAHEPGTPLVVLTNWVLETGPASDDSLVVVGTFELDLSALVSDNDLPVVGGTGQ